MVYQAGARGVGWAILAEQGLHRGVYNMVPPSGKTEEISFQLATSVNEDGTSTGMYYVTPDNGLTY
eukprot:5480772-Heterocapsa_arctica.AAC.1